MQKTNSSPPPSRHKVMIVDDIQSIRFAVCEYLEKEFEVYEADGGGTALKICENTAIDLVITDIRMPGMSGIELIRILRKGYPKMKFVLMTAYNVDQYIHFARTEKVWNIIPKSTFLNLNHILILARKLFSNNPFGIDYYFHNAYLQQLHLSDIHSMHKNLPNTILEPDYYYTSRISSPEENTVIVQKSSELLSASGAPTGIYQILEELSGNAMKHSKGEEGNFFELSFGILEEQTVIGVVDYAGTLDRNEILLRLLRHAVIDMQSGLPLGLEDSHGRGLYISREHCEHLIFNIEVGKKTEIIAIIARSSGWNSKAISIFQI